MNSFYVIYNTERELFLADLLTYKGSPVFEAFSDYIEYFHIDDIDKLIDVLDTNVVDGSDAWKASVCVILCGRSKCMAVRVRNNNNSNGVKFLDWGDVIRFDGYA